MQILRELVTDSGQISSGRAINIGGFITGTILLLYHGLWLNTLNYDVFGIYMAYAAGVYGTSKWLDRKYGGNDDRDTDKSSDRYQVGYDSNDEYNVAGSRDRQL